jgi:hypothetical protein
MDYSKPLPGILKNNNKVLKKNKNKNKHISFSENVQYKLIPTRHEIKDEYRMYRQQFNIDNNKYNNNDNFCYNYFIFYFIIIIFILYLFTKYNNKDKKNNIYNNLIL